MRGFFFLSLVCVVYDNVVMLSTLECRSWAEVEERRGLRRQ